MTVFLSDNEPGFKNSVLNEAGEQLAIKGLFSNPLYPQGYSRIKTKHNMQSKTLTKLLESSDLEQDELLPFVCYCYNILPSRNGTKPSFFLTFGCKPADH